MPSNETIQAALEQGVTGALILGGFLGCGLVLAILLLIRWNWKQQQDQIATNNRHDRNDELSLAIRQDHIRELQRLGEFVNASILSQKTFQGVVIESQSMIRKVDDKIVQSNLDAVTRYSDAMQQVQSYTSNLGKQIDTLPIKMRDELKPVLSQLSNIEAALVENRRKTDEIIFLLQSTEQKLLDAIQKALMPVKLPVEPSNTNSASGSPPNIITVTPGINPATGGMAIAPMP